MSEGKIEATFEPILRNAVGFWSTAILSTALEHDVFSHLAAGAETKDDLAAAAGISERGAQALLDGLAGLNLVRVHEGRYQNSAEAHRFLVRGTPSYFGDFVKLNFKTMPKWLGLPSAVRTGQSVLSLSGVADHEYWEELVTAIAPLSVPVAEAAASRLGLADRGAISVLDIAGGAGAFSAVFLSANPCARSTQVDWANVNRVAREFVGRFGVADRFHTIDGDFLAVDYGDAAHDVAVYSHMAHGVSPEQNLEALSKLRRALKPDGMLVVNEFVVNDDGTAHPFILMFSCNILFHSSTGRGWRVSDYRRWLEQSGFSDILFEPTDTPATLIYARADHGRRGG